MKGVEEATYGNLCYSVFTHMLTHGWQREQSYHTLIHDTQEKKRGYRENKQGRGEMERERWKQKEMKEKERKRGRDLLTHNHNPTRLHLNEGQTMRKIRETKG